MNLLINQNSLERKARVTITVLSFLVLGSLLSAGDVLADKPTVGPPVAAKEFKGDLRLLPKTKLWQKGDPITEKPQLILPEDAPNYQAPTKGPGATGRDGALDFSSLGGLGVTPPGFSTANPNFAGIGATGFTPPDTNGDVGPNHYIQMVNASLAIWDKKGTQLLAPTNINQIWSSAGDTGVCANQNRGDPYVVYDHLADRWLISEFARDAGGVGLRFMCIAISQTANPVNGGWHLYTFDLGFSNDYPKIGVWPDGYYMVSQRGYNGNPVDVTVFDRANMLNGAAATFQNFQVAGPPTIIMLPSDLDGTPPPQGTPNFFARPVDGDAFGGADRIEIREFHVDWGVPANSTLSAPLNLPTAAFSSEICDGTNLFNNCIAQPGAGSPLLEALSVWPMGPLQYRNFGTYETLVFNHTVDVDNALSRTGVRWYELRRPSGGAWSIHQQGTYAPDAGNIGLADDPDRWMGSIAMDKTGNMALGYSVSATNVSPSIRYVGRQVTDPLGLMPTGEIIMQAGSGFQNGTRWGDYSAMRVDPVDDCTFWYTQEYTANGNDGSGNPVGGSWLTRIGAFRFDDTCGSDLAITKTANPTQAIAGGNLTYTMAVTNKGPLDATNVKVTDTLPSDVEYVSNTDSCLLAASTLTCTLGTINKTASKSFDIQVKVKPNASATVTNTATVAADQHELNEADNTSSVTTIVNQFADLQVTKQCKPDGPAAIGTTATCTIFVDNLGSSDAKDVILTDTLLSNGTFTLSSATPSPDVGCVILGGVATCNLGTEPAGGKSTITVQFTSNDQVDVNDTATVQSSTFDPVTANNIATGKVSFSGGNADLSLVKTATPNPVVAGENLTYTLTVTNIASTAPAPNVVVKDVLPAQVSLVSATPSQGACSGTTVPGDPLQPLTCNVGSLANLASATITVVVKVNSATSNGTNLVNNASVSSDRPDPNNGNNNATAASIVNTKADLVIVKTADKAVYKPSSLVTYTVKVKNNGSSDARQVIVTDNLPDPKQAIYKSDTGGCVINATTPTKLTCNMGYIPLGESRSFQVYVLVRGSRGLVSNNVTALSSDFDPNLPNSSTSTVTIGK
jgi:uncharacterized repeat protein (TIGR01451 family)